MSERRAKEKRKRAENVFLNGDDMSEILCGDDFNLLSAFENGNLIVMSKRDYELFKQMEQKK